MKAALLVLATLAGTAHADPRRLISVLEIRVEGVPPDIAQQFQNNLEQQLDSKRYWLVPRAKVKERMTSSTRWVDGCTVGKCLFDVKTQTGAELVLTAALSGSGTSFGYVVTLLRTDIGEVVAQQSDRCDVCTLNEVMTNATLATIQLINAVPDVLPDREAERHAAVSLAVTPLDTELERSRRGRRHVGIALTLVGIAVGGAGAALYYSNPKSMYLAGAAAGGGILVGGLTVLTF